MNEYAKEFKGYYIKPDKLHPRHYAIVTVGKGGKIPDRLSGMFTSTTLAMSEISVYLDSKKDKEDNGKQSDSGGSK
jgi:hypothetical protein